METKLIRCTLYITGGADTRWSLIPCAVNYNNKSASPPTNISDSCQYLCVSAEIFWKYCSHGNTAGIQALTGTRVKASQSRLMDAPLYLSLYVIDSITCCSRGDWQLLGWLKFVVLDLEVNSVPVWWRLVHFITSAVYYHWFFFKLLNFLCAGARTSVCSCVAFFTKPPLPVMFGCYIRNFHFSQLMSNSSGKLWTNSCIIYLISDKHHPLPCYICR